ncbi:MAG: 1-acyl-sn-glycerol-3-phosphate acyltransferase [Gemmatimonadetes bacterium]|nr:1-acyl-sn-glycerol-3-phosphate acyltransferase [Gemmatimonadota bacterium]
MGSFLLALLAAFVGGIVALVLARHWLNRMAVRAIQRMRPRLDRFKLTAKPYVIADLMGDARIAEAVRAHAAEHGMDEGKVWARVEAYLDEIVPFFNVLLYYRVGYTLSKWLLETFYKVSVEYAAPRAINELPRDAVVVYLMNHRSNADYVLVSFVLAGEVSISYAVGEWARAFPLEYIFKSFGSYFIRRRYREPLYHVVLERYVQLITRNGVTQGIFPEGGLTRDGKLLPAKIGLLDYILGVGREAPLRDRMYIVPVAINYDRVLEDRSLLLELATREGRARRPSRLQQMREVGNHFLGNVGRAATGRFKRYGRAAVTVGEPVPLAPWFAAQGGDALFALERPERLGRVQQLADDALRRIGAIIPVTPVPLACAAIQSLDADFIPRPVLLRRMEEMRDVLVELNGRVLRADRDIEETFERAWRMLGMRKVLVRSGDGYVVMKRGRPLVSYYANSVAHLLGPFAEGVRRRDALPALAVSAPERSSAALAG